MALWKPSRRLILAAPALLLARNAVAQNIIGGGVYGDVKRAGGTNPFSLIVHTSAAAASSPATSAVNTTGANLLIVAVSQFAAAAAGSLGDSKSNTWSPLTTQTTSVTTYSKMFYCAGPTVGAGHTFTYTGSSIFAAIAVQAWSGANVTQPDVQNGVNNGSSVTSQQVGSVTPSANNFLIVSGVSLGTNTTAYAIDSSFTKSDEIDYTGGTNIGVGMAYLKQGTAAAVNPTWSWATSSEVSATIAVFKS